MSTTKLTGNYVAHQLFSLSKVKILKFQLLKDEHFQVSLLFYDSKLHIFRLWVKQDIGGHRFGLWETQIDIFHNFMTSYKRNIQLINQENNLQIYRQYK